MLFSIAGTAVVTLLALVLWMSNGHVWWLLTVVLGIGLGLLSAGAIRWVDRHGTWELKA
jgi:hypothetical protein